MIIKNIEYKKYSGDEAIEAGGIAISNRLYVPGWELTPILFDIKNGYDKSTIVLAYSGYEPIAILVMSETNLAAFFVRVKFRRKGIGSNLFKIAVKIGNNDIDHGHGIDGSYAFFHKLKIKHFGEDYANVLNRTRNL